jgi:hypothetical protein
MPVYHEYQVLEEAIYDALYAASATGALPVSANGLTAAAIAADAGAEIADAVWDEALSGHQTAGTAGRNLTIAASILGEFTLTGTPTSTVLRISGGSAVNDYYNDLQLIITSGALIGQARPISDYDGGTGDITVDEAFTSAPASGVTVAILASHAHPLTQIQSGLATAAGQTAIETDTQDIQSRLPAALVGGHMPVSIEAINGGGIQGDGSSGNKWRPA